MEMNDITERYELVLSRIREITEEKQVPEFCLDYFQKQAAYLIEIDKIYQMKKEAKDKAMSLAELRELNCRLYQDILPENYGRSYGNPAYAVHCLGKDIGPLLCFLYAELRGLIAYAYEQRLYDLTIYMELFVQVYCLFVDGDEDGAGKEEVRQALYWFVSDFSDWTVAGRVREQLDPSLGFARDIIMESDLTDLRYLYSYGEYISDAECRTAEYLNTLPQGRIEALAKTFTEGYRKGFINTNKDISKKKTVNIRYQIGFERIVRAAVRQFQEIGLDSVIFRYAVLAVNKRQHFKIGYQAASANPQFDYDHKGDQALFLDNAFKERKLGVLRTAYEKCKELAAVHGGPAVMEVFGEELFVPESKEAALRFSPKQEKLSAAYDNEAGRITNEYIPGEERSFTIIAYPVPSIGKDFERIFDEVVKINTLDYELYQRIQQHIIDVLDQGQQVFVKGAGDNKTDLTISLFPLKNPEKETIFENCVADVNIPVGEVFTSPVLKGTSGTLHVSHVYLNGLPYRELEIQFTDGKISGYTCANFDEEDKNKRYIKENILYNHQTLPLGEFAIGTNTTAYVMAKQFGIEDKLPILIAEKMGPHFAVGDTCYSWSEDTSVYNADGKEIVARDNEISRLRTEDLSAAYFNCHTDITIPYEEIRQLGVIKADGEKILILENGRFVLAGTEELNKPFG